MLYSLDCATLARTEVSESLLIDQKGISKTLPCPWGIFNGILAPDVCPDGLACFLLLFVCTFLMERKWFTETDWYGEQNPGTSVQITLLLEGHLLVPGKTQANLAEI